MMNSTYYEIAASELHQRIKAGDEVTILDVRSPAEYQSGHIPGSRLLPIDEINNSSIAEIAKTTGNKADNPIYVTCWSGLRAKQAANLLTEAGIKNLILLSGGTEAWQKKGLPTKRCGTNLSLERQVQIAIGSLLILKVFFGFTVHELFFVAGAVIGAGLISAGITRWCGMAQLIARMPWNRERSCSEEAKA